VTPPRPSGFGALPWLWWPVLFAGWALAACAPASDPDPRCRWPGFRCAIGGPPMSALAVPPVTVDNPFRCPRRASP
jgi:hypothetical protein